MTRYRVTIQISPRRGILDPQGKAVADALHTLGFGSVADVRVGRHITLTTEASSASEAEISVKKMCEQLLANPVIEDFHITTVTEE